MSSRNNKERILECAKELFHKYGIRSISMDDIAHHLGISKKTIYQHFSDKDDIITLAMHQATSEKKDMLLGLRKQAADSVEMMIKIHQYIHTNFDDATASLVFELQKIRRSMEDHPGIQVRFPRGIYKGRSSIGGAPKVTSAKTSMRTSLPKFAWRK